MKHNDNVDCRLQLSLAAFKASMSMDPVAARRASTHMLMPLKPCSTYSLSWGPPGLFVLLSYRDFVSRALEKAIKQWYLIDVGTGVTSVKAEKSSSEFYGSSLFLLSLAARSNQVNGSQSLAARFWVHKKCKLVFKQRDPLHCAVLLAWFQLQICSNCAVLLDRQQKMKQVTFLAIGPLTLYRQGFWGERATACWEIGTWTKYMRLVGA